MVYKSKIDKQNENEDHVAENELNGLHKQSWKPLSPGFAAVEEDLLKQFLAFLVGELEPKEIIPIELFAVLLPWSGHQKLIKLDDYKKGCKVHNLLHYICVRLWGRKNLPHGSSKSDVWQNGSHIVCKS